MVTLPSNRRLFWTHAVSETLAEASPLGVLLSVLLVISESVSPTVPVSALFGAAAAAALVVVESSGVLVSDVSRSRWSRSGTLCHSRGAGGTM